MTCCLLGERGCRLGSRVAQGSALEVTACVITLLVFTVVVATACVITLLVFTVVVVIVESLAATPPSPARHVCSQLPRSHSGLSTVSPHPPRHLRNVSSQASRSHSGRLTLAPPLRGVLLRHTIADHGGIQASRSHVPRYVVLHHPIADHGGIHIVCSCCASPHYSRP